MSREAKSEEARKNIESKSEENRGCNRLWERIRLRDDFLRKHRLLPFVCVLFFALVFSVGYGLAKREHVQSESGILMKNHGRIVASIREGLKGHSREITLRFHAKNDHMDGIEVMTAELIEEALLETEDPTEGDYIRYQYGGYEVRYSQTEETNGYLYQVRIIPRYYTYLSEEEEVTEEVHRILETFHFTRKTTDYEKVRTIYDYVYDTVSYDAVHKKKENHHRKTTAYAALFYKTAVCQGYSVLLYRMLREAGVEARVITGTVKLNGNEEFHAWNLVGIDGVYYNLDATLGKAFGTEDFFLKSDETFSMDHIRDEQYSTKIFYEQYPMTEQDYEK